MSLSINQKGGRLSRDFSIKINRLFNTLVFLASRSTKSSRSVSSKGILLSGQISRTCAFVIGKTRIGFSPDDWVKTTGRMGQFRETGARLQALKLEPVFCEDFAGFLLFFFFFEGVVFKVDFSAHTGHIH